VRIWGFSTSKSNPKFEFFDFKVSSVSFSSKVVPVSTSAHSFQTRSGRCFQPIKVTATEVPPTILSKTTFVSSLQFGLVSLLGGLRTAGEIKVGSMVLDEVLIDRCVGRRLDPVTGKIYHVKNFLPETDEIKARPTVRADDTEEKVVT
ncbi:Adenylate kinase 5, chloroplastic, partial [Linum perenne]